MPILAQAHRQYGSGRTELTAKVLYLSCVMQYPLYGTTMFPVSYRGYWSYGNSLILGVNCEGIILIKPDDKFVLYEFRYSEIESIMLDPSDSFITISLNRHTSTTTTADQQRCFVFETSQKNEIGSLIVSYFPALSNWITENEVPPKKSKGITNEDRVRLHHNVVVCRRHLVDAEILRKPQDPSGGFLRNTLRRLSKHRLEKLRAEHGHGSVHDHGETYKGFPHAYWAFSRQALPQSLSKIPDQEEQAMIQVFNSILTYAGLGQNGMLSNRNPKTDLTNHSSHRRNRPTGRRRAHNLNSIHYGSLHAQGVAPERALPAVDQANHRPPGSKLSRQPASLGTALAGLQCHPATPEGGP